MRAVIQRVARAEVSVDGQIVGAIGKGLVVLLGVGKADGEEDALWLAKKVAGMRIFGDENERLNLSVLEVGGQVLVVSQFTLWAEVRKGRRPSFTQAAAPAQAQGLYLKFIEALAAQGVEVATGRFGAHMQLALVNDGPVTIWVDTQGVR